MAGLDVAGGAVGIISLGIQVCQGLLSYYHDWKSYGGNIDGTYKTIAGLEKTFKLINESLTSTVLDRQRASRPLLAGTL